MKKGVEENPKSIVEIIISSYPVVKDLVERLKIKKLTTHDLMLLMTVHNTKILEDNSKALSGIESSIRSINDEFHRLHEDLKPILEAVAELIKAEAEKRKR